MEALAAAGRISAGDIDPMARPAPPPVYRPQSRPQVQRAVWPPICRVPAPIRLAASPRPPLVQPKLMHGQPKLYPNLNASAAIPVDRNEIFKLHSFFDHYRIVRGGHHGQLVANSKYIFCRMMNGDVLLHPSYRHPAIAAGKPVLYAGEMYFDNGRLDWWSNGSGNYRPDAHHAEQADLPMDRFYTYEEVLRGRHMERTMGTSEE